MLKSHNIKQLEGKGQEKGWDSEFRSDPTSK